MSDNPIKNLPIEQISKQTTLGNISKQTSLGNISKQNHLTTMLQVMHKNKEQFERATMTGRAMQEQAERLMLPIKQMHDEFERITQAIANPFGKSFTANATAPTAIEYKPPKPHHHNSPALSTLASVETAKNNENEKNLKIENQILLQIVERLTKKPENEPRATLAEMPLIANTLALQVNEIANLRDQLEQKEREINALQAQIDQQATATPANYALSVENSSYTTPFIDALNGVIQEFWINYQEHNIPPKQDTVISWVMEHYNLSRAGAKAIEQVARPAKAKTGGIKSLP
ncbi:hypothetical protein [Moraxella catarrhalis]|uniref:hypothetical protein n=1 Tax=Moraxella catarrhalis TaxID=480 RepID=UPI001D0D8D12|nr:hypothetical protein [Moraxella catarrhalis]